jgi:hypothetical protein
LADYGSSASIQLPSYIDLLIEKKAKPSTQTLIAPRALTSKHSWQNQRLTHPIGRNPRRCRKEMDPNHWHLDRSIRELLSTMTLVSAGK